jgi:PIN domain nuclease of toxin-antitoxin system
MRLLIDTHVLVWAFTEPGRLPSSVTVLLEDWGNEILVSAASAYEIEFKRPIDPLLGRLPVDLPFAVGAEGFGWRSITPADAIMAARLPRHHRDPWDRIMVAQCLLDGVPLISCDGRLAEYGVQLIW